MTPNTCQPHCRHPDQLLRALGSERLGSSEEALSNPLVSASSGALSTLLGPVFRSSPSSSCMGSRRSSRGNHLAGAPLCSRRRKILDYSALLVSSGVEMTLVGAAEGAVTYGIGILLGKGGI